MKTEVLPALMLAAALVVTLASLSPAVSGDLHRDEVHGLMKQLREVIADSTRPDHIAAGVAERSGAAVGALLGGAFETALQLEASRLLTSIGKAGTQAVGALIRVGVISSLVRAIKRAVDLPDEELASAIVMPLHQVVLVADENGLPWKDELFEADGLPPLVRLLDHQHEEVKRAATTIIRKLQFALCVAPRPACVDVAYTLFEHGALKKLSALLLRPDVEMRHNAVVIVEHILMPILDDLPERPGLQQAVIETIIDSEVLPKLAVAASGSHVGRGSHAAAYILPYHRVCNLLIHRGNDTQQVYAAAHGCIEKACVFLTARVKQMQAPLSDWDYFDTLLVDSLGGALRSTPSPWDTFYQNSLSGSLRQRATAAILTTHGCGQSIKELVEHPTDAISMRAKRAMELLEANVESMEDDSDDSDDSGDSDGTDTDSLLDESDVSILDEPEGPVQFTGRAAASIKMLTLQLRSDDKQQLLGALVGVVEGTFRSERATTKQLLVAQYADQLGESVLRVLCETEDDDVQRAAGEVLGLFAGSGPRVVDVFIRFGAIPSLVQALRRSTELSGRHAAGALSPLNILRPLQLLLREAGAQSTNQLMEAGGLPLLAKLLDHSDLTVKAAAVRILAVTPGGHRVLSTRIIGIAIILAALVMLPRLWRFLYVHLLRLRQHRREQQAERHQRDLLADEEAEKNRDNGRGGKGRQQTTVRRRPVAQPSSGSDDQGGRLSCTTASSSGSSSGRQTPSVLREESTTVAEMESDDGQWKAVTRNRSNRTKRGGSTQATSSHQTPTSASSSLTTPSSSPVTTNGEGHPSEGVSSATSSADQTPRDTLPISVSIPKRRRAAGRGLGLTTIAPPPPSMGAAPPTPWLPSAEDISSSTAHRPHLPPPPPPPPSPPEVSCGAALSDVWPSSGSSVRAQAGLSHNRGPPPLVKCGHGHGSQLQATAEVGRFRDEQRQTSDTPQQPHRLSPSASASTTSTTSSSAAALELLTEEPRSQDSTPQQETAAEQAIRDGTCVACHEPGPTVVFFPCKQRCLCAACWAIMSRNHKRAKGERERLRAEGVPDKAMDMAVQIDAELKCPACLTKADYATDLKGIKVTT
ncbi:unnamed protein product [Vitrella brassicaformis CCMP3155]|uniref:RING-type domain-containing protein n=1 Tax=Vitrella brassicaformis (strain CCMP3155) TaxID=1169540 RepID=A0A0G4GV72_VITBC|nr:unnamed protein product [Vitrella brassicaformis CCMP3155]|eukprot:CEM34794.1 unnamed protein product [Vitrella brassicaformis CCMP3155]